MDIFFEFFEESKWFGGSGRQNRGLRVDRPSRGQHSLIDPVTLPQSSNRTSPSYLDVDGAAASLAMSRGSQRPPRVCWRRTTSEIASGGGDIASIGQLASWRVGDYALLWISRRQIAKCAPLPS